jgi:hypothetical protein
MRNATSSTRRMIALGRQRRPALFLACFVYGWMCDLPASAQTKTGVIARLNAQETPEKAAKFVWDTILTTCKRPEEASPSLFYYRKYTENHGSFLTTNLVLQEFVGPFTYSAPAVRRATEAEKRNRGLQWTASATFRSTAFRITQKHSRIGLKPWTEWQDTTSDSSSGVLTLTIERDSTGATTADLIVEHLDVFQPIDIVYLPVSCAIATSSDPFSIGPPLQTPQSVPKVGQFVCSGAVLGPYGNRPDLEHTVTSPARVSYVEIRNDMPPPKYLMAVDGLKTPDGSTPMVYIRSGPPAQDSCPH